MKAQISSQRQFEQALLELSRTFNVWDVFNDFLDYSLLMMRWWDLKPGHFASLEKKYTNKAQHLLFAQAFFAMGNIADNGGIGFKDPFGDFFMEHLSNNYRGQFFTPETVCDMTAKMIIGESLPDKATVGDPCCGSGRLLLSAAKLNRNALFYGADVDLTCCKMTALNLFMNTLCGEVAWMDSLSLKHWKSWRLKKVMDGDGRYRPYYIEVTTENDVKNQSISKPDERVSAGSGPTASLQTINQTGKKIKPGQLSFFFG